MNIHFIAKALAAPLLFAKLLIVGAAAQATAPPVSVKDIIEMTRVSDDDYNVVSPKRDWVAAVVYKGNVAQNTMEYSLLVFRTAELMSGKAQPQTLAKFSAVSNDPVISQPQWISDEILTFCAQKIDSVAQVYAVNVRTRELKQLTHARQRILIYRAWENGDVVYIPQEDDPAPSARDRDLRARGFYVSPESWRDTFSPSLWWRAEASTVPRPIYARATVHMVHKGKETTTLLPKRSLMEGENEVGYALMEGSIGSTLDYVMVYQQIDERPEWSAYRDGALKRAFDSQGGKLPKASVWSVMDMRSGASHPLTGLPVSNGSWKPLWLDGGKSVIIPGALLPVDGATKEERELWTEKPMVAEFDISTGKVLYIFGRRDELEAPVSWDPKAGTIVFDKHIGKSPSTPIGFRKTASGWEAFVPGKLSSNDETPRLKVREGMNEPWKLFAVDPRTNEDHMVYDPNPGLLQSRRFANKTVAEWQTKAGAHWRASLYWPPDYVKGKRYPLFIQTYRHGIGAFRPEGAFNTGFAAQALAVSGMFVLQIGLSAEDAPAADKEPQREYAAQQEGVEAAIDYMDGEKLIDRAKVGINGFSQTCGGTLYFLTHSNYPMAVAAAADGVDYSYLNYLAYPTFQRFAEARNGGKPFVGQGLDEWLKRSPGFGLNRMKTPLLLTEREILAGYEPYAALMAQGKPAEMLWIPEGVHDLVKPWTRVASQQGTVDWVRFWLQAYERTEPIVEAHETTEELADRYVRWRKLRDMQNASLAKESQSGSGSTLSRALSRRAWADFLSASSDVSPLSGQAFKGRTRN